MMVDYGEEKCPWLFLCSAVVWLQVDVVIVDVDLLHTTGARWSISRSFLHYAFLGNSTMLSAHSKTTTWLDPNHDQSFCFVSDVCVHRAESQSGIQFFFK